MSNSLTIRPINARRDLRAVTALETAAFRQVYSAEAWAETSRERCALIQKGDGCVAIQNRRVVGALLSVYCTPGDESNIAVQLSIPRWIAFDEATQSRFLHDLATQSPEACVVVTQFEHPTTVQGATEFSLQDDAYISMIVVDPRHQRQGVGEQLLRRQLEIMRERGVKRVSTHCLNHVTTSVGVDAATSPVPLPRLDPAASPLYAACLREVPVIRLFDRVGFGPLLHVQPGYENGNALAMGMLLET